MGACCSAPAAPKAGPAAPGTMSRKAASKIAGAPGWTSAHLALGLDDDDDEDVDSAESARLERWFKAADDAGRGRLSRADFAGLLAALQDETVTEVSGN